MTARGQAQEFTAGAHPAGRELVVRMPDGRRLIVVAVDETRQRRLADLFARLARHGDEPGQVAARWRVLHHAGHPAVARLDVAFREPLRLQVRVLFDMATSVAVRHAATASHLCLVSATAFSQMERKGVCGEQAVVLPSPPADVLELARRRLTAR